jgi:hypothetical protein
MACLDQTKVERLLGRPLSKTESSNYKMYLNIAKIRLSDLLCDDIAELDELPDDLALVWARFFAVISDEQQYDGAISQKRVEDFYITYQEGHDPLSEVMRTNAAIISKYSKCSTGIRHGGTIYDHCV